MITKLKFALDKWSYIKTKEADCEQLNSLYTEKMDILK